MMMPPSGRQVAGREDAEGLQQAQPVRHGCREEQLADDLGEENENDEIVELERAAKCGKRERLVILAGQRASGMAALRARSPGSTAGGGHEKTRMDTFTCEARNTDDVEGRPKG
jgi:hypothetical protein